MTAIDHSGDIFYTLISWKLLGAQTIGAYELFMSLLTLTLKMFSIIFIFYILKFTKLETNFKILFFTILSLIVLTFSSYNATNYLSIRDLYVFIFFIFFIQSFYQKEKTFLNFLMSLIAVSTIFLHIDIGFYLIATLFLYKTPVQQRRCFYRTICFYFYVEI